MSTRIMAGLENLEGGQTNTLRIGRMLRRRPEPLYLTVCDQCDAESSATHTRLRNGAARCLAAGCGKSTKPTRDDRTLERLDASARETARIAEEREASARRMETESADWVRPVKYAPSPTPYQPRSDRERAEMRERRAAEEAEETERLRPIREAEQRAAEKMAAAEEQLRSTASQLAQIERERIATGLDDQFAIDPATIGESALIPTHQLDGWHAAQSTQFLAENPGYYKCDENRDVVMTYLKRNAPALKLISAAQLTAAYKRLSSYGLLQQRPAPAPEKPAPQPRRVNLNIAESHEPTIPDDGSETGWDWATGQPLTLTARQVLMMSSTDYRRFKKLDKEALALPNYGPGLRIA